MNKYLQYNVVKVSKVKIINLQKMTEAPQNMTQFVETNKQTSREDKMENYKQ